MQENDKVKINDMTMIGLKSPDGTSFYVPAGATGTVEYVMGEDASDMCEITLDMGLRYFGPQSAFSVIQ